MKLFCCFIACCIPAISGTLIISHLETFVIILEIVFAHKNLFTFVVSNRWEINTLFFIFKCLVLFSSFNFFHERGGKRYGYPQRDPHTMIQPTLNQSEKHNQVPPSPWTGILSTWTKNLYLYITILPLRTLWLLLYEHFL